MQSGLILAGFLILALLPATAAAVPPETTPAQVHAAMARPIAAVSTPVSTPLARPSSRFSETVRLVLIGSGLMALAAVVKRTTRIQ